MSELVRRIFLSSLLRHHMDGEGDNDGVVGVADPVTQLEGGRLVAVSGGAEVTRGTCGRAGVVVWAVVVVAGT